MSSTPQEGSLDPSQLHLGRGRSDTKRFIPASGDGIKQSELRGAIADEMASEMVECSIGTFQKHYMPFTPDTKDVDKCIDLLVKNSLIAKAEDGTLTWKMWRKKEGDKEGGKEKPVEEKEEKETEAQRFKHFVKIVRSIREYNMSDNRTPSVSYLNCPDNNIVSEIPGGHFKIDGCFSFLPDPPPEKEKFEGKLIASTIAVPAEFKLSMSERTPNSIQLLSCVNHIMNDDPCRMFTYGINMEGEEMTVWYYCRSHSCKSESFNFVADCRMTVVILMGFIFAKLDELGLDPTVHRIYPTQEKMEKSPTENGNKKDTIQYVYEIECRGRKRFFKTIRSLFSYRSLRITGRSTRVWEAIEVSDATGTTVVGEKRVALKDVWLDEGARTEKMHQDMIFDAVKKLGAPPEDLLNGLSSAMKKAIEVSIEKNMYRNYFMGIDCDWQGRASRRKASDARRARHLFSRPLQASASYGHTAGSHPSRSTVPPFIPPVGKLVPAGDDGREFRPKKQYRLVYSEVAKTLAHVPNFKEAGRALEDACIALAIMWLVGWVHRDISIGNILYTINSNNEIQGKLSDLEYAKEFDSKEPCSPDPKTGTPYFMATEILLGRHFKGSNPLPKTLQDIDDVDMEHFDVRQVSSSKPPAPPPRLVYNYQHDLESIFWIVLWLITSHLDYAPSQEYGKLVFVADPETNAKAERFNIFQTTGQLLSYLPAAGEEGKVFHKELEAFVSHLDAVVQLLYNAYIERTAQRSHSAKASYTSVFKTTFFTCQVVESIHKLYNDPNPPRLKGSSNATNKENDQKHKRGLSEATMTATIQDPPKRLRQAKDKSTEDNFAEQPAEWIPRSPIRRRL